MTGGVSDTVDHPNVARVRAYAGERGVAIDTRRFPAGTRTAEDAARAIGVGERNLVPAAGVPSVRRATAVEAKDATGYAIGGVPPFAHATPCRVLCDRGLLAYDVVWAAAGLPDAVFAIAPADLVRVSGATVADVAG